ncbi:MAG: hypothetical protein MI922_21900 [Bacteroidales bacterium]|nr:hypothetical protein [Bacteroidales bacterium]
MVFINRILFFAYIFLLLGCNEKFFTYDVDCDECYLDELDSADLKIKVTLNETYDSLPLTVYKEEVGSEIVWEGWALQSPCYIYVKTGEKYAVEVVYNDGDKTIKAVNSTKLKTKQVSDLCDDACWVAINQDIDATLAF